MLSRRQFVHLAAMGAATLPTFGTTPAHAAMNADSMRSAHQRDRGLPSVGLTEWRAGDLPVTLVYPTAAKPQRLASGPFEI